MGKSTRWNKSFKIVNPVLPSTHTMFIGYMWKCDLSSWETPASTPSLQCQYSASINLGKRLSFQGSRTIKHLGNGLSDFRLPHSHLANGNRLSDHWAGFCPIKGSTLRCLKPTMVVHPCSTRYPGGWGKRVPWPQEFKGSLGNMVRPHH